MQQYLYLSNPSYLSWFTSAVDFVVFFLLFVLVLDFGGLFSVWLLSLCGTSHVFSETKNRKKKILSTCTDASRKWNYFYPKIRKEDRAWHKLRPDRSTGRELPITRKANTIQNSMWVIKVAISKEKRNPTRLSRPCLNCCLVDTKREHT